MSLSILEFKKNLLTELVGGLVGGLPGLPSDPEQPALPGGDVLEETVGEVVDGVEDVLEEVTGDIDDDDAEPVVPGVVNDLLGVPSYSDALEDLIDGLGLVKTEDIESVLAELLPQVSQLLNLRKLGESIEDALGGDFPGGEIPGEELQPVVDLLTDILVTTNGLLRTVLLGTVEFVRTDGLALVDALLVDVYQLIDEITGGQSEGNLGNIDIFESLSSFLEGVAGSLETFLTALTNHDVIHPEDLQPLMEVAAVVQAVGEEVVSGIAETGLIPELGDEPGEDDDPDEDDGRDDDNSDEEPTDGDSDDGQGGNGSSGSDDGQVSDDSPLVGDEGVLNFNTIMLESDDAARGTEEEDHFVYHQPGDALILDFDAEGGDKLVFDTGYDFDSVDDILPFLKSAEFLQNDIVNLDFGEYGLISIVGLATQDASWDLVQVLS